MSCLYNVGLKRISSSELLVWPHKRPPHWDYLVICSPNFYEVAPLCVFFFCSVLFLLFHALRCYDLGGVAYLVKAL